MAAGGRKHSVMASHFHRTRSILSSPSPRKADRPLRVALFSGNYDCVRDGANQALNKLVHHLESKHRATVRVYSPRARIPAFAAEGDIRAVRSLGLPGRPEYRLALGLPRATRADLDGFSPDIVHLSAPDWLGWQALGYARRMGIPAVASLHTRFETYADYYRLSFLRPVIERYLNRFYGRCDRILAPTRPIAEDLARVHGEDRVGIWGRGVDRARFHPALRSDAWRASHGYDGDDVVPLFFGRLVLEKGLDLFAETIASLRARGHRLRPLIVGEGPARGWLAQRLPNATFTGHLEGEELGCAIASADILVNPSVTEAFGNVNLEAMASGLCVVSANVPSASALVTHGRTGLLVDPTDAAAYADAVEQSIRQPHRRRWMSAMASAQADRYDWGEILSQVYRSYVDCLGDPPTSATAEELTSCAG